MTLTELVNAAKNKDDFAIGQLMERVKKKGKYVALKYVHDDMRAEDILQDAFIRAFDNLDQLQDPEKFDAWFFVILNNLGKNATNMKMIDKNSTYFSDLDSEDMNFEDSISQDYVDFQPKENFDYSELQEGVRKILDELPDAQRVAVIGYFFEGLNMREIADIFEVGESTIRARLNSAKKKMAETIKSLEAKGMPLFGVAPASVFNWYASQEASQVVVYRVSVSSVMKGLTASAGVGSTASTVTKQAAVETVKKGAGSAVKSAVVHTISIKTIITVIVTVTVVGGGVIFFRNSDSHQDNFREDEQMTEVTSTQQENSNEPDWKKMYKKVLHDRGLLDRHSYFRLLDLSGDSIPDLYCEDEDGQGAIFIYVDNGHFDDNVFYLGTDSTRYNALYNPKENWFVITDKSRPRIHVYRIVDGQKEWIVDARYIHNKWFWMEDVLTEEEWMARYNQYVEGCTSLNVSDNSDWVDGETLLRMIEEW